MKQVIQSYRTGSLELAEVPVPRPSANSVLVQNAASVISIGTERSIIDLGKKSLLGKARARPDLVRRFVEKAKNEGLYKTFQEALGRLDSPTPLGYSSAGIVVEAGSAVHRFSPGDRVACVGAGYAAHADYVVVPENLCARVPDSVDLDEAAFGMLGTIALHGIRCAELHFGETVAVIGLGLLGLLGIQILRAYGCTVIGFDLSPDKCRLAAQFGLSESYPDVEGFSRAVERLTRGNGADAVLVTASTQSDAPVNLGVEISRYRGRIVLTGVADVHPNRNEMWHKEVQIIVSRAGGPGLLDPVYENKGIDYPFGYVRWTENRNLEEFLSLIAQRKVDVRRLISSRYPISRAEEAYKAILGGKGPAPVGVVLDYVINAAVVPGRRGIDVSARSASAVMPSPGSVRMGVIGAGVFGKAVLLPALVKTRRVKLMTMCTAQSATAAHAARKFGFAVATTDYREVFADANIDAVAILTPHRNHATMILSAIESGKHIYVEKPLCVNEAELASISEAYRAKAEPQGKYLLVGYNRRFSPHTAKIRGFFSNRHDPLVVSYRVNAGFVPKTHWVHGEEEGGSRVIGEICHFVDWIMCVTGSRPTRVFAERVSGNDATVLNSDNLAIVMKLEDGSVGTIVYSAQGDRSLPRECIEVYSEGRVAVCTDFRETVMLSRGTHKFRTGGQQFGYSQELEHFAGAIIGYADGRVPFSDLSLSTLTVFKINESMQRCQPVDISLPGKGDAGSVVTSGNEGSVT